MAVKRQHTNKLWLGWNAGLCIAAFLLGAIQLTAQSTTNYFRTQAGIPCLPILDADPSPATAGAMYINSGDNNLYFYDGTRWTGMPCYSTGSFSPATATSGRAYTGTLTLSYSGGVAGTSYPQGPDIASTGITGLTATLQPGTLTGSDNLIFHVTGTPSSNGVASFAISFGGKNVICNFTVVQQPTAPDGTLVIEMQSPVTSRIWMDRNLGATQQATSLTDVDGYGSLFQWCRAADGHQSLTSNLYSGPVASAINLPSNSWYGQFVTTTADWLSTPQSDGRLWWDGTAAGANNPCPTGYHVPTEAEWAAENITSSNIAFNNLKLPLAGFRSSDTGAVGNGGITGRYWSSTAGTGTNAKSKYLTSGTLAEIGRGGGSSIRCIKNL